MIQGVFQWGLKMKRDLWYRHPDIEEDDAMAAHLRAVVISTTAKVV